jgi:iron complex outermembrane receptor protein
MAQEAQAPQADEGAAIIVTGTRAVGMQAADSAAPVQVLSDEALSHVGQPNLNQALTQIVPSFTAQTQGTDMSNFSLSARLRGLSPNHTLVMVNGKRRHGSAILQVIAGPFGGSAAPSIDLIPPDAVSRIEILQEGAAAQYGTDAIAGVVNIILKDQNEGGSFKVTGGQYYDSEGETFSASGNVGFKLGEDGYFNLTGFHRRQDYTTTGTGQVAISDINGNPWYTTAGTKTGYTSPTGSGYYNPAWADLDLNGINGGQAKSTLNILFYNMGYDFGGVELYSFGDVSHRLGYAYQGYRVPSRICAVASNPATCFGDTGTYGMVPQQKVEQKEYSFTVGAKGEASGWNYDFSTTYGSDKNNIWTIDSANRSLWINTYNASLTNPSIVPNTPTSFYDGSFKNTQLTTTLDIRKEFDIGMAQPLTFAFGGEYRKETYAIGQGDYYSTYLEGGQSFPGYRASDVVDAKRQVKAVYVDFILNPVEGWSVDLAGRYEDYSDFGDTQIGKITTRYDFSDAFAIRGTASTGFRAPTMAESFYSSTNVSPTSAILQLPPGSVAGALLGFPALKPEKSTNFSGGIVLRPIPKLAITIDGYYIKIKDRIALTAPLYALISGTLQPGGQAVLDAIAARGVPIDNVPTVGAASFTNGIDTRTWGVDLSARYPVALDFGKLDISLSANYNETKITKNKIPTLFNATSESYIEDASPKYKIGWGMLFTSGRFTANLRETFYGKSSVLVTSAISGLAPRDGVVKATGITDLELGYDFTDHVTFSVGSNNLFNKRPEKPKLLTGVTVAPGQSPYENGSTTWNGYYGHGAYGTSGGYYYARLDFKF